MPWLFTIDGEDRTDDVTAGSIELMLNDPSTAQFTLQLPDGSAIPDRFAEVVSTEKDGITPLFGGVVQIRDVKGIDRSLADLLVTLDCMDWWFYADVSVASLSYDSPVSLKQVLLDLIDDPLGEYGLTLDVAQPDGPDLAPFSWTLKKTSEALRELSQRAPGYVVRISAGKVLSATLLGSTSAPFAVTDAAPHVQECNWRDSNRLPANRIILVSGPTGEFTVTKTWIATGAETFWDVDIQAAAGSVVGSALLDGVTQTVGTGAYFDWQPLTGKGRLVLDAGSTPTAGQEITIVYTAVGPFTVIVESGATPPLVRTETRPDIVVYEQALELANGLLAAFDQSPRELDLQTDEDGLFPSQGLTVSLGFRAVTADALITAVTVDLVLDTDQGDALWEYRAHAPETETYQGSYLDEVRELVGSSSGSSASVGVGGSSTTVLSSPFFLGGSRNVGSQESSPAWSTVIDYNTFVASASFTGRVRADLWALHAGVAVKVRLHNITDDTAVESSYVTSEIPIATTFIVSIVVGKRYRLERYPDTAGETVFVAGAELEAV